MKIELGKRDAWYFGFLIVVVLGVGYAIAYGSGGPASTMGHSLDELEWSDTIPEINVNKICLNGNCISDWSEVGGSSGGICDTSQSNIYINSGTFGCGAGETIIAYRTTSSFCNGGGGATCASSCLTDEHDWRLPGETGDTAIETCGFAVDISASLPGGTACQSYTCSAAAETCCQTP